MALLVSIPFLLSESTVARVEAGRGASFERGNSKEAGAKSASSDDRAAKARERADRTAVEKAREELRSDPVLGRIWEDESYESNLAAFFRGDFDPKALRELLDKGGPEFYKISNQILLAAAERNPACQDLLKRSDLRQKDPALDLALCAYDYMVNGNAAALQQILDAHRCSAAAADEAEWGNMTVWVLGYVDEWPKTEAALGSHALRANGEEADSRYAFWLKRRYFFPLNQEFPQDYGRFWKDLDRAHGRKED